MVEQAIEEKDRFVHRQIPSCCSCHLGPIIGVSPVGRNYIMITLTFTHLNSVRRLLNLLHLFIFSYIH